MNFYSFRTKYWPAPLGLVLLACGGGEGAADTYVEAQPSQPASALAPPAPSECVPRNGDLGLGEGHELLQVAGGVLVVSSGAADPEPSFSVYSLVTGASRTLAAPTRELPGGSTLYRWASYSGGTVVAEAGPPPPKFPPADPRALREYALGPTADAPRLLPSIAPNEIVRLVAVNQTGTYYVASAGGRVRIVRERPDKTQIVLAVQSPTFVSVVATHQFVYTTAFARGQFGWVRIPIDGGPGEVIEVTGISSFVHGLFTQDETVFYSHEGEPRKILRYHPKQGKLGEVFLDPDQSLLRPHGTKATHLYFQTRNLDGTRTLSRAPTDRPAEREQFMLLPATARAVDADDCNVYWVDDRGAVFSKSRTP